MVIEALVGGSSSLLMVSDGCDPGSEEDEEIDSEPCRAGDEDCVVAVHQSMFDISDLR